MDGPEDSSLNHSDAANDPQDDAAANAAEAALACNCCRRRKLRCSREVPTCQQCRKTGSECVYETKRAKPGMKAGAIENLHRRLDALERTVQQQSTRAERDRGDRDRASSHSTPRESNHPPPDNNHYGILSFFARELQRFNETSSSPTARPQQPDHEEFRQQPQSAKRRRLDTGAAVNGPRASLHIDVPSLPDDEALEAVLRAYFHHIHPWIPLIHEGRLRRRLLHPPDQQKLRVVLHAMVLASSRYIEDVEIASAWTVSFQEQMQARDWVVAQAMKDLSVESLQALAIIAFNDIGSGDASLAWSVVGSLTRTVEYLQLTIETDESERLSLVQPWVSLPPPQDWTEAEERRRVFWNVFNLDRLCSVTMGWNTSLTSDDVNRRLPCDGITWRKEDPVETPYFGIWDKAAGRIGNPIAFIPSHYSAPAHAKDEDHPTPSDSGTSPGALPGGIDMSNVGAFAYSVEATESLSRVNSYFLQQKVNMRDNRDLTSWLTRFKEMDLRLVHWKMFLPQKWKANMARQSSRMDPNLTLAHVTHNASMILLHQVMAFPSAEWTFKNRLPSLLSVDTCQAAAVEIATITQNYLKNAPPTVPVASQFAFCVYVAAKSLLLHWRYTAVKDLTPDFWSLVQCLDEMAKRWTGPHGLDHGRTNLAAKYSQKLTQFHTQCVNDESFRISVLGYTTDIDHASSRRSPGPPIDSANMTARPVASHKFPGGPRDIMNPTGQPGMPTRSLTPGFRPGQSGFPGSQVPPIGFPPGPPNPLPVASPIGPNNLPGLARPGAFQHRGSTGSGELGAISQVFMDQQFMDMDRVISYDDGVFGTEYEGGGW